MPKSGRGEGGGGGFFRSLVLLGLIGLAAYNTFEIAQLKTEIASLKHGGTATTPKESADISPSLLRDAKAHLAKAEDWMHLKRYEDARREMTEAAHSFQKANVDTRTQADKILTQLRTAADRIEGKDAAPSPSPGAKPAGEQ